MPGQADCGRAVLAKCTRIRQRIDVNRTDDAILVRADAHTDFHFMPRRACDLAFLAGIDHLGCLAGFPRHQRGIYLGYDRLLRAESAADTRLFDMNLALRDIQRICNDTAHMEHDLRRGK